MYIRIVFSLREYQHVTSGSTDANTTLQNSELFLAMTDDYRP